MIRERATIAATAPMLSDAGRADRDRLLVSAAVCLLLASPMHLNKVSLGPFEASSIPDIWLRLCALGVLGYFGFCFAMQGKMDFMRWRSALALALVDIRDRIELHRRRQDDLKDRAENAFVRFQDRVAEHRRIVDPLQAEFEVLMETGADPDRKHELFGLIKAEHARMTAFNEVNPQEALDSDDLGVIEVASRRVAWFRRFMGFGRWFSLIIPLAVAMVAAAVLIWTMVYR